MHNFSEYSTWQEQKLVVGSSGRYCQSSQVTIKSNEQHTQEGERGRRGDRTPAGGAPPRRAADRCAGTSKSTRLGWGGVGGEGLGVSVWEASVNGYDMSRSRAEPENTGQRQWFVAYRVVHYQHNLMQWGSTVNCHSIQANTYKE